jgi:hypothetical protein
MRVGLSQGVELAGFCGHDLAGVAASHGGLHMWAGVSWEWG